MSTTNPAAIADKKLVETLEELSKDIFGAKHRWRKLADRKAQGPEEALKALLAIKDALPEEEYERLRAKNRQNTIPQGKAPRNRKEKRRTLARRKRLLQKIRRWQAATVDAADGGAE